MPELSVLTLNCWGLRFFSKLRRERLKAIADRLADGQYDIVALQEIWVESQDWQYMRSVCADRYPHGKFFFTGAFGSGLAIMSRHPIVSADTHMYRLTGTPIFVQEGDWIAGKGCGRVTIAHSDLGLVDVYTTHTTAHGGQVGPEVRRAYRTTEAFELAQRCALSAQAGRHVICTGDFNSLPTSLCMSLLHSVGGLQDSLTQLRSGDDVNDITCDSPRNTWTKGKKLDPFAVHHGGKRLDYILFRGPTNLPNRLACTSSHVTFTELARNLHVSYSDHFGVEATFSIAPATGDRPSEVRQKCESKVDVLQRALRPLYESLHDAHAMQKRHMGVFLLLLALDVVLIAGVSCASAWLWFGRSVAPSIIISVLIVLTSWAATTALYSGVVWGEWLKRMYLSTDRQARCVRLSMKWRQRQALILDQAARSNVAEPCASY